MIKKLLNKLYAYIFFKQNAMFVTSMFKNVTKEQAFYYMNVVKNPLRNYWLFDKKLFVDELYEIFLKKELKRLDKRV